MFYTLYVRLGRLLFWLLLPLERVFIRKTHRVYALITKDNKVLMIKNWLSDGKWALPGGGVARHETSEEALARELKEELDIIADEELKFFASGHWQNHGFGFKYDLYIVQGNPGFRINRKFEITDATWVDKTSLNINDTASDIVDALTKL